MFPYIVAIMAVIMGLAMLQFGPLVMPFVAVAYFVGVWHGLNIK